MTKEPQTDTSNEMPHKTSSSTVALGTATAFLVIAAIVGFLADDKMSIGDAGWSLRGTLAPGAEQPPNRSGA